MTNITIPKVFWILFIIIIVFSIFIRVQELGYSGFQGDEVNTIDFLYEAENGVVEYLFSKKRGPVQYLINIVNVEIFGFHDELQIRLPYLIFGVLALISIYKLSKVLFDEFTAFFAMLFIATNGLYIAFARITQYQSLMYLLTPIGVLLFVKAIKSKSMKTLLYSGLLMSFLLISHYDTLSVVPFFISVIAGVMFRNLDLNFRNAKELYKLNKATILLAIKRLIVFFVAFIIPAAFWYVPFSLGENYGDTTSGYLSRRLFGGGLNPRIHEKFILLTMYLPKIYLFAAFTFGMIGIFSLNSNVTSSGRHRHTSGYIRHKLNQYDNRLIEKLLDYHKNIIKYVYLICIAMIYISTMYASLRTTSRKASIAILTFSVMTSVLLIFNKKIDIYKSGIVIWFLGSYCFYFYVMRDPRTHVYITFIPLFILAGYGIRKLYFSFKEDIFKYLLLSLIAAIMFFITGINYMIFVDKSPEYPWTNEKSFLGWGYKVDRVYHAKIEGVFGFNNYRGWDVIAKLFNNGCLIGDYASNEKDSITYFYLRRHQNPYKKEVFLIGENTVNAIWVEGPHSWVYTSERYPSEQDSDFILLHEIKSKGHVVTKIYGRKSVYKEEKMFCNVS